MVTEIEHPATQRDGCRETPCVPPAPLLPTSPSIPSATPRRQTSTAKRPTRRPGREETPELGPTSGGLAARHGAAAAFTGVIAGPSSDTGRGRQHAGATRRLTYDGASGRRWGADPCARLSPAVGAEPQRRGTPCPAAWVRLGFRRRGQRRDVADEVYLLTCVRRPATTWARAGARTRLAGDGEVHREGRAGMATAARAAEHVPTPQRGGRHLPPAHRASTAYRKVQRCRTRVGRSGRCPRLFGGTVGRPDPLRPTAGMDRWDEGDTRCRSTCRGSATHRRRGRG